MPYAPIVIFSYNRPLHLKQVLDALEHNRLANQSDLYIYCDGAKETASEEQKSLVAQNKLVAHTATGFKSVTVIERERNYGLADNIFSATTEIVNKYGRIITLEDDVVTSPGFLQYMNDALEMYKDDERVMHITAFMWRYNGCLPTTFFYTVPECGGGWATWKRAWDYFSYDVAEAYDYWKNDWTRFNMWGGNYMQKQLEDNYNGKLKTWFIRWYAVVRRMNGLTLYPNKPLTTNIGFDGSGSNCVDSASNPFAWTKLAESIHVKRVPIIENRWARIQIYCAQQGHFYSKRNRKRMITYFKELLKYSK